MERRERSGERSRGAEVGEQEFWRSWRSIDNVSHIFDCYTVSFSCCRK